MCLETKLTKYAKMAGHMDRNKAGSDIKVLYPLAWEANRFEKDTGPNLNIILCYRGSFPSLNGLQDVQQGLIGTTPRHGLPELLF